MARHLLRAQNNVERTGMPQPFPVPESSAPTGRGLFLGDGGGGHPAIRPGIGNGRPRRIRQSEARQTRWHGRAGSHARPQGPGQGTRTGRQPNPRHSYPGNGGSQGIGRLPGQRELPGQRRILGTGYSANGKNGSYQACGYPGSGPGGKTGHEAVMTCGTITGG